MGTNFYVKEMKLHIGKRSVGWVFSFQAQPKYDIYSSAQWFRFLREHPVTVVNEYGEDVSYEEFSRIVLTSLDTETRSQYDYEKLEEQKQYKVMLAEFGQPPATEESLENIAPRNIWKDALGFSVSLLEFS